MPRCRAFLLCAFPALSAIVLASDDKTPAPPASSSAANERGVPALFSWGDIDGDGRLDLAAVSANGTLQILANVSDGRFEDVTERVGLFDVDNAALALWADYDGDGRLDLFVGAREGASRLFHNDAGSVFLDMSAASGLSSKGAVQSAQWFDFDSDGRLDLFVATPEKNELFRGRDGGRFELSELPLAGALIVPAPGALGLDAPLVGMDGLGGTQPVPGSPVGARGKRPSGSVGVIITPGPITQGGSGVTPLASIPADCAESIRDQTDPGTCLEASTTPTLGLLYPISSNLFVAVGGNVGIGTTSPTATLDVAGTARMTDTLTLNPSGDQALNVSTGSIYKGGALFIHTKGGVNNTALGRDALLSVTTGTSNTATGDRALRSNTTGHSNTANGMNALFSNTTGFRNTANGRWALRFNTAGTKNTACGYQALQSNTIGSYNTASGDRALFSNTTGGGNTASGFEALSQNTTADFNTASGYRALYSNTIGTHNTANGGNALGSNTTGNYNTGCGYGALKYNSSGTRNIALGYRAGYGLTTGNDNIAIGNSGIAGEGNTIRIGASGTHTRTFVAGIRGVTTDVADAIPVVVDSTGQLGTVSSSRRFKKDIADMGNLTERLLELRPVVFHYKQEQTQPNGTDVPLEYGLIAEEVADIFPDLVVYDDDGKPFTVKYHLLSSMLLNELKKQSHELMEQRRGFEARFAALESRTSPATTPAVVPADRR